MIAFIRELWARVSQPWHRRVQEDERFLTELQEAVRHDQTAYREFLTYLWGDR